MKLTISDLKPGEVVEFAELFPGLTGENMCFKVDEVVSPKLAHLSAFYLGVYMGGATLEQRAKTVLIYNELIGEV